MNEPRCPTLAAAAVFADAIATTLPTLGSVVPMFALISFSNWVHAISVPSLGIAVCLFLLGEHAPPSHPLWVGDHRVVRNTLRERIPVPC